MSLPTKGTLTGEVSTSEEFGFCGKIGILIYGGSGEVWLERSLEGSEFYPITYTNGDAIIYEAQGEVVFNGDYENPISGRDVKFRLNSQNAESIQYIIKEGR